MIKISASGRQPSASSTPASISFTFCLDHLSRAPLLWYPVLDLLGYQYPLLTIFRQLAMSFT